MFWINFKALCHQNAFDALAELMIKMIFKFGFHQPCTSMSSLKIIEAEGALRNNFDIDNGLFSKNWRKKCFWSLFDYGQELMFSLRELIQRFQPTFSWQEVIQLFEQQKPQHFHNFTIISGPPEAANFTFLNLRNDGHSDGGFSSLLITDVLMSHFAQMILIVTNWLLPDLAAADWRAESNAMFDFTIDINFHWEQTIVTCNHFYLL